ncbi:MAG: glycosyltransferase family 2 protein [Deltaproteobacteria bacterium]|nr:glycosyltransferase family 2 protein [Deltaproteobacteria bacterium]
MLPSDKKIYVVIPAFNNESTVSTVVEKAKRYISHVIVVDDGSTDQTAIIAKNAGAEVISISSNKGKGNTLRVAFQYALNNNLDAIITLDADLQHDPNEIPRFVDYYIRHQAKIVIGNRMQAKDAIPRIRYGPNKVGVTLFSWLIGQPIEDSQCGFRLYDRQVIKSIRILNMGFEAEADILLRAGKRGYRIGFVPIQAIYFSDSRHVSYYRPIKDTFRISIIFLMNLFWKDR